MARSDDQVRGDLRDGGIAPCGLADGFHRLRWNAAAMAALIPQWNELARTAVTPNPFYETWFLIPSLREFDPGGDVRLNLLVSGGQLVALMPDWTNTAYHGHRLPHIAPWIHANIFCALPLVSPGYERAFWDAFLDHVDTAPGRALFLHLPRIPTDSPVTTALLPACAARKRLCRATHREQRALLRHGPTPEAHLASAMSAKKRKELRRQRKRLEEEGEVAVDRRRDAAGLDAWTDRFLDLEKRGWKGDGGTALANDTHNSALFREALAGAAAQGRLERLELSVGGTPLAMLVNFLAPPGAFSFKTAFDEDFARYSPGVLLQIENLAMLDDSTIAWCDSCAAADHPMIERIWRDRREIAWFTIPIGGRLRRTIGATLAAIEARRSEKRA